MPTARSKAKCPFVNGPRLGLSLQACHKTQEVDLFWHFYDTNLHGFRLTTKAVHKIIDLVSSNKIDSVQRLDLTLDEIYCEEKKKEPSKMPREQETQPVTVSG